MGLVIREQNLFSDAYGALRQKELSCRDMADAMESELQRCWRTGCFAQPLKTREGHRLRILAPGWLNKQGGPDFTGAQLEFNGTIYRGDVEIHRRAQDWFAHGHQHDQAYNNVLLHVVHDLSHAAPAAVTASGRAVATLVWPDPETLLLHREAAAPAMHCGACAATIHAEHTCAFRHFLELAGEWRILEKARRLGDRARGVGPEQALYEAFMAACGYSAFKDAFAEVARALPYDRARQIALQEPQALEAVLLRLAGLLPETWTRETDPPAHYQRMLRLWQKCAPGLRSLPLTWSRAGSRPANAPERRLAGAAVFLTRTAEQGLHRSLEQFWRAPMPAARRRNGLEAWFGGAAGFWAAHCSWHGAVMTRPGAPLGSGRIRSIIGNVLFPASIAWARREQLRSIEEEIHAAFALLPREPENQIERRMRDWLHLDETTFRLQFKHQQGLLQIHEDWCARNPSCAGCSLLAFLHSLESA